MILKELVLSSASGRFGREPFHKFSEDFIIDLRTIAYWMNYSCASADCFGVCLASSKRPRMFPGVGEWRVKLKRCRRVRKKRKTTITIETDRLLVIRKRRKFREWCKVCGEHAEFATLGEACALTFNSVDTIYQLLIREKLHSVKAPDGLRLICLQSVIKQNPRQL